jgi:hypothetical protein
VTGRTVQRALRHRPVLVTAVLLLAWIAVQVWAWSAGEGKLRAAGLEHPAAKVHVELLLRIAPEPFHVEIFQDAGRLVAVRDGSVFLMDVPPDKLRSLASRYWVRAVKPWAGI